MEISFEDHRLESLAGSERYLRREYGADMCRTILRRLGTLAGVPSLEAAQLRRALRLHELSGNRSGQFAVGLEGGYRLILKPNHDPIPRRPDGGIILSQVTAIIIIEIVDYH